LREGGLRSPPLGIECVLEGIVEEKIAGDKLSPEKSGWLTEVLKREQLLGSCPGRDRDRERF